MLKIERIQRVGRLVLAAVALTLGGCGPVDPGTNGNGNGGNANDNGGTGNTVDDLPDLSADDQLGTGEGADAFIPGLILIGFNQTITDDLFLQLASSTATALGAELVDVIPDIRVSTLAVEPGTEAVAIALAEQLQSVDYAEADFAGRIAAVDDLIPSANSAQFVQYQLFVTGAIKARGVAATGSGNVSVAVLDTGCAVNHSEFASSAISLGANYISGGSNVNDDFPGGHGTGVVSLLSASTDAGEIAGLLPGFEVSVHKVCDQSGACPLDAVVLGLIGALNGNADLDITTAEIRPADVINVSLSFSTDYRSLARAIFVAEQRGVAVVAAAGNNGRSAAATGQRFPASYSTVISVGASDISDTAAPFSNRSADMDLVAPGVDLFVAAATGGYQFVDGTSYAAVQVAAAAAWLLDRDASLTPFDVRTRLNARGDALAGNSGFGQTTARRLNILAALQDQGEPPEPYIIPDDVLTAATGVAASTLASGQSDSGAGGAIAEAFTDEQLHWYGYFPGGDIRFELIDAGQRQALSPDSLATSSIDLFLEFVRGIELGETTAAFGVLQQVVFTMPDLGGERRSVELVAISDDVETEPRTFIYNPLLRGYNIISYKNFDSSVLHLRDEEGASFDPTQADIELLGFGPQPEINWSGGFAANRVLLGSSLDPVYFVQSEEGENEIAPPVRLGACVGAEVAEQICGQDIGLPENQLARILVRTADPIGSRIATLDVIYVP